MRDRVVLEDMRLPYWMDMLWENAATRTTKFLCEFSDDYKKLKDQKRKIMEEEPELAAVLEGDAKEQEIVLDAEKVKKLSELFGICTDILWLYEKMFYAFGILDGIKMSEVLYQMNKITD